VLWATHLVDEAERADRVVVLHLGSVIGEGAPGDLLTKTGKPTLADAFIELTGPSDQRPR
jgi:ABC-2 type transport system ATP-binding protein